MKDFGKKLKDLRMKKGESQKDLANFLNISFQSISKWEQGIHYPDVFAINRLSEHYNVGVDYFFDSSKKENAITLKKLKESVMVSVNEVGPITVWTSFIANNKIAPASILDSKRHRSGSGDLKTHPGPKDTFILVVNEDHEICFLGEHKNDSVPSCGPQGNFYSQTGEEGRNNPCFIIEDTYLEKKFRRNEESHEKDFEFVIPPNGFIVIFPRLAIETKNLLLFMLPKTPRRFVEKSFPELGNNFDGQSVFKHMLCSSELNHITVYLEDNTLVILKEEEQNDNNNQSESIIIQELRDTISDLEERIDQLQMMIDDVDSKADDVDSRIDDLESRFDTFETESENN